MPILNKIKYPKKFEPVFDSVRNPDLHDHILYYAIYGGRGSGKSESVARYCIGRAMSEKVKILCCRESQKSLADSVHSLLVGVIFLYGLQDYFDIQRNRIICRSTGSIFIFSGLRQDAGHIRSMHDVDIVWIEEGQYVGLAGWSSLDGTIRKEGSKIIIVMNPRYADDPLYRDYVATSRPDTLKVNMNITDNAFATKVQIAKARFMMMTNPERFRHEYLGELKEVNDALIFAGRYEVKEFEAPYGTYFLFGADWGFSTDPTVLTRMWVKDDGEYQDLMVDYSVYTHSVAPSKIGREWDKIPASREYLIKADPYRPDSIQEVADQGFFIEGAKNASKNNQGANESGIERLKGFRNIIIHPRCKEFVEDIRNFSYEIDPSTEKPTRKIRNKFKHGPDTMRYGTEDIKEGPSYDDDIDVVEAM